MCLMHLQFLDMSLWVDPHLSQTGQPGTASCLGLSLFRQVSTECSWWDSSHFKVDLCLKAFLYPPLKVHPSLLSMLFPLWVVHCSLWLRVNYNSYGESPQCYFKRYHKWGKRKKKKNLTFYQNIKLLAIVCKDLGTRPTWPPKNSRGQILQSK